MESVTKVKEEIAHKVLSLKHELISQKDGTKSNKTIPTNHLQSWRENIITIYAASIAENLDTTFEKLEGWGNEAVHTLVNANLSIEVALDEVRDYRNLIGKILMEESSIYKLTIEQFYEIISNFDSVVDRAVQWLSTSYTESYFKRIYAAESTALELSIPVIQVTDDVGVLPLIGDIDTQRAQELMDKALTKSNDYSLEHLIIDLSSVTIIDTMVAGHIFKVVEALKMSGVNSILTGIRPEVAQTMIHLGIDITHLNISSTLRSALKDIY
ncbi:STAS domain-containing protein [Rossellomorea marisflavi]|uniref:STAS domain-containing protein n=1 Tax=Rossellomorea marisflavi TaxID=189381 RepID=UPI0025B01097|nr:STAS domain-containing protein [Rossellomorea marisflavi]MDW4525439.1 STAS domain-containing protein [Rossellomorea marisflavi]WJV18113.1 STAS domain-containing protein [Rossellomorea marisflavi]